VTGWTVLAGCGKTTLAREKFEGRTNGTTAKHSRRMLKKTVQRDPSNSLYLSVRGVAKAALDCAHRTSTVSSCAFCEQRGHLAAPCSSFSSRALREHGNRPSYPTSFFSILLEEGQRLMTISRATLPLGPKGF